MTWWEIGLFFVALVIVSGGVADYADPVDVEPSCSEALIQVCCALYIIYFVVKAVI